MFVIGRVELELEWRQNDFETELEFLQATSFYLITWPFDA